jgi:hypothetical protein
MVNESLEHDDDTLITRGVATSRQMLAPVLQPVRRKLKPLFRHNRYKYAY